MSFHTQDVFEFMEHSKQTLPHFPTDLPPQVQDLRAALIWEEVVQEALSKGLGCDFEVQTPYGVLLLPASCVRVKVVRPMDMVELVDGCLDGKVVLTGTLLACGIDADRYQEAVDLNNLAKFGPGHSYRDDGKLIKPPDHVGPPIAKMLENDGYVNQQRRVQQSA